MRSDSAYSNSIRLQILSQQFLIEIQSDNSDCILALIDIIIS